MFNQSNSTIMKRIICKFIEFMFPEETALRKEQRALDARERRAAMQTLLDASRKLRDVGFSTNGINERLRPLLSGYEQGEYERVASEQVCTCVAI